MSRPVFLKCVSCGHEQEFKPLAPTVCVNCKSGWVEAHYDYPAFKRELLRGFRGEPLTSGAITRCFRLRAQRMLILARLEARL